MTKHFVQQFYPGSFVSECSSEEIDSRESFKLDPKAFGFRFFDRACTVSEDGKVLYGKPKNYSPTTYVGRKLSMSDVAAKEGSSSILYNNMRINKWEYVVETKYGQCFPLEENDLVISEVECAEVLK